MDDALRAGAPPAADHDDLLSTSQPFVGRWNQLVSTTNWEKGHIIVQWRQMLIDASAPAADYSDEAWSRLVGGVTGQHVGRLRRVYDRFGQAYPQYEGLYWSHFQAAVDWDDAEMWLEGAVQNRWSVSQMRRTRWETLGAVEQDEPRDDDIIAGELDEDFEAALTQEPAREPLTGSLAEIQGPAPEGPDFGEDDEAAAGAAPRDEGAAIYSEDDQRETIEFVRPFANLSQLPDDLADAFESFKLAILRHKTDGWQKISRDDVLAAIDALKELALAPATDGAPF